MREDGALVFPSTGTLSPYLAISGALLWVGLLFYLANDYLWSEFRIVLLTIVSLAAAYVFIQSAEKLRRMLTAGVRSCLLVTPHYVIDANPDHIRYWDLEQIQAVDSVNNYDNARYLSTEVTLTLDNVVRTFTIRNLEAAERSVEQINCYRKLFIEAVARGDSYYLDSNDDLKELKDAPVRAPEVGRPVFRQGMVRLAIAFPLIIGLMFGAVRLNGYYDDKKSWEAAAAADRASSFRSYLQTHPAGRWRDEANGRLSALYEAAEEKYQSALKEGYDPPAVQAVLEVLRYARQTQNYRVGVVFERHNEIPPTIVEDLKEEFEVERILSPGDAFGDEAMNRRENRLLEMLIDSFRQIIPDDILEISRACPAECVNFVVKYKIDFKQSLYYDTRQEDLPEDDRVFYPGVFIDWDFGVRIPHQPLTYRFSLTSAPADEISYDTAEASGTAENFADVLAADKGSIYDSMMSSAFEDFTVNLIHRVGIGPPPTASDEETPAPPSAKNERK